MKKIVLLVFASVVLLSAMLSLTKESTSFSEATIYVDPLTNDVSVGNTFVINVSVADVADLSGFGFYLGYNTTILDVLSVWVPPPFEPPIIIPPPDDYTIHVAATSPIPFSGSFTLASITFNTTAVGSSILDLYDITLSDSAGDPIPHTIVDGSVTVSSAIITVPDDYPTIQEAINAASDGDTIFVRTGTYYENVVVSKSISLVGENKVTTNIDGSMTATVVAVTADNVTISQFTIRNGGSHYAGIRLSSNGNNITNNIIWNNWCGISLEHYSAYNVIADNSIMNNLNGIFGELWSDTRIIGNTLRDNLLGIWIGPYSKRNTIAFNNIRNHWSEGISMWQSSYNTIVGNNITDNNQGGHWAGIVVGFSSYNQFFHNNIANKEKQIDVQGEVVNVWDDGYPSGGNYWSDYTGVDVYSGPNQDETGSDGVGDKSYVINTDNTDRYPPMGPISFFDARTWDETTYYVHTVSNSTVSHFYFSKDDKLLGFDVTGPDDTVGFCRVAIPNELLWCDNPEQWQVWVNNTLIEDRKITEDANYTYVYFTYSHSSQNVEVIGVHVTPEFPTWTSMLLILILLTVAIAIYKRRLLKTPIR